MSNIKIRSLTGNGIRTYIPSIVQVRSEVLRDLPPLRNGNVEEDTRYLQQLCQLKDAIAILVFDHTKIVGVALGLPLENERPAIQKPILDQHLLVSDYYFFSNCSLLPAYRGRGLTHHFFDLREAHVQHLKRFKKICLLEIVSPTGTLSLDPFWRKRGYVKQRDLTCQLKEMSLVYWMKDVSLNSLEPTLSKEVEMLSETLNAL